MSKDETSPTAFPGFTEMQKFWQSALKQIGTPGKTTTPDAFAALQAVSAQWMSHRQDDFTKALDTFRRMALCKSPAEAAELQRKWVAESVQSLMSDWLAFMTPTTAEPQARPATRTEATVSVRKVPEKTDA
jgi:hypothetical protein